MNHTAYLTPPEYIFQISTESVYQFNLEFGEHRDIESQNYHVDYYYYYYFFNKMRAIYFRLIQEKILGVFSTSSPIKLETQTAIKFCDCTDI